MSAKAARRVLYSGRVQGVGFRYTTHEVAQTHAVTGFVRNLRDGRVELVAEGAPAELESFLAAVARAMSGSIDSQDVQTVAVSGTYQSFDIAR